MRPVSSFPSASQGTGPNITTYEHHMLYLWHVMGAPAKTAAHGTVGAHHILSVRAITTRQNGRQASQWERGGAVGTAAGGEFSYCTS
jgi:hypothetical protein